MEGKSPMQVQDTTNRSSILQRYISQTKKTVAPSHKIITQPYYEELRLAA
jgi:hypothetical protein